MWSWTVLLLDFVIYKAKAGAYRELDRKSLPIKKARLIKGLSLELVIDRGKAGAYR